MLETAIVFSHKEYMYQVWRQILKVRKNRLWLADILDLWAKKLTVRWNPRSFIGFVPGKALTLLPIFEHDIDCDKLAHPYCRVVYFSILTYFPFFTSPTGRFYRVCFSVSIVGQLRIKTCRYTECCFSKCWQKLW